MGVPALDWLNSTSTFSKGLFRMAANQRPPSKSEVNAGLRSLPFGNWMPLITLLSTLTPYDSLPYSVKD